MPGVAPAVGGWTLADQVGELRGKYHLKKKDLDAYRESSKSEIKENEKSIGHMRQETKKRHILVADHENGDERVIKTVFKDDRKERLSLQRLTADGAIDEMDQMVCQAAQFLDALRYEREKRDGRLNELKEELERMQHIQRPSGEVAERNSEVTRLENSLDKAQVKYETASSITRCYRDILDKLREESLTLPAKLDAMEAALLQQKKEMVELQAMAKATHMAREEAKQQLAATETMAYESKRKRDIELSATRKEVERRQTDSEKTDKRAVRAALLVDTSDLKALETAKDHEKKRTILSYEEAFKSIMEAANVTSIEEAVERVAVHKETQAQLRNHLATQEASRNRLQDTLTKLTQQHSDMKYTGEQKMSRGQRRLEDLKQKLDNTHARWDQNTDQSQRHGDSLLKIKAGITTLVDKLDLIKLKPPEHSFTKGDVFEQLDLCRKKLENLNAEVAPTLVESAVRNRFGEQEFQEFLEGQLSPDNLRIKLERSESTHGFNHMDSEETQEVLTRHDLKKAGQKLIDSKEKPKKKRAKKSK